MMRDLPLCPKPGQDCDDCTAEFLSDYPGVEAYRHTTHVCECPWVAWDIERDIETCVGCGKHRDTTAEFWARYPADERPAYVRRGAAA